MPESSLARDWELEYATTAAPGEDAVPSPGQTPFNMSIKIYESKMSTVMFRHETASTMWKPQLRLQRYPSTLRSSPCATVGRAGDSRGALLSSPICWSCRCMEAFLVLGRDLIFSVSAPEAGVGASTPFQAVSSRNVTISFVIR